MPRVGERMAGDVSWEEECAAYEVLHMARNDGRGHSQRRGDMVSVTSVIDRLVGFQVERADLNEMVELLAQARPVRAEFESLDIPVPEALSDGIRTLGREVKRRADDAIEMRLRELDIQDAADRTASERRGDRDEERKRLLAKRSGEANAGRAQTNVPGTAPERQPA